MINHWHADMQHGDACLCERCLRDRRREQARERIRASIENEQQHQQDMLAGAKAVLEGLAAINAGGAPVQVNPPCTCNPLTGTGSHADWCPRAVPQPVSYKHGEPVLRACEAVTVPDLGELPEKWVSIPVAPPYVYTGQPEPKPPAAGPCFCDWCLGRPGVHGPRAVALYKAKTAEAHARLSRDPEKTPFTCPGCGFTFAGRTAAMTSCQYCGKVFPALVTPRPTGTDDDLFRKPPALAGAGTLTGVPASREAEEKLAPDPVRELTAAIREPLGLDGAALDKAASYTAVPAGYCQACHQPVTEHNENGFFVKRCWYCETVYQAQITADEKARSRAIPGQGQNERPARSVRPVTVIRPRRGSRLVANAFLFSAGAALICTGLLARDILVIIPGIALILAALLPWRRTRR